MEESNPLISALIHMAGQLPLIVVWLVGLIFAAVRWGRHPSKSLLMVIALTIFFVNTLVFPLAFYLIRNRLNADDAPFETITSASKAVGITHMFFNMGAWILLLLAAFWPAPSQAQDTKAEPTDYSEPVGLLSRQQAEALQHVEPLSKPFYVSAIAGAFGLALVLTLVSSVFTFVADEPMIGGVLACFNMIPLLFGVVVMAVFLHRIWSAIQFGPARTTPGKAVGFLFIPFFNFYWGFQVYWGWAKDYNRFVNDCQLDAPVMPEGLALTLCVFTIASSPMGWIPFVGPLVGIGGVVLLVMFMINACAGIEALAQAGRRTEVPAPIS